ncbi:MAG: radical SAM protein [Lachnospiraceae bacterium]|nr:radical SAM protein [Lachnospiraceae bacterium]
MEYEGMVYRPPSEARSLIIQVTIGCAHNKCTFCTMYKEKQFRVRKMQDIFRDLDEMAGYYGDMPLRIFLADGDALVLSNEKLLAILDHINEKFSKVQRITSYATAKDVLRKSVDELKALKAKGLDMVYVGAESGDPEILKAVKKDVTCEELIEASKKLKAAGIDLSLTLISGLGGRARRDEHAIRSAELVTAIKPEYLGFLTLMLEEPAEILEPIRKGEFELLRPEDIVEEMRLFLEHVDSEGTVFRANHASNYIILKGNLNRDIPSMLAYLEEVEQGKRFRAERYRRL